MMRSLSSTSLPFLVCHFIDVKDSYSTVVITRTEWELDFLRMALPDSMRGIIDLEEGRVDGWIDGYMHTYTHTHTNMQTYKWWCIQKD